MSECGKTPTNPLGYPVDTALVEMHNDRVARLSAKLESAYRRIAELEQQLAEAQEGLDGIDQALANAEHWMGKCEELERQIVVISAESEKLKEMVARYLVAIYDVPIRQVDCRMDTDKIDQLHDDIIDEIGQEYIDSAMKGGER